MNSEKIMFSAHIPTTSYQFGNMDAYALALSSSFANPYGLDNTSIFTQNLGLLTSLPALPTPDYSSLFSKNSNFSMPAFSPFNFGDIMNNTYNFSSSLFSTNQTTPSEKTTYQTNTSSKIKPGLLKGNLRGKEAVITQLCEKYNVDVALVLTIIGQESGFGTSNLARHNNFMGYRAGGDLGKDRNGHGYFSTPEKGLEAAIKNLARYPQKYKNRGVKKADMNNIDAISKIYCETSTYATAIKSLYNSTVKKYLV